MDQLKMKKTDDTDDTGWLENNPSFPDPRIHRTSEGNWTLLAPT